MLCMAKNGTSGGSLSEVEILTTLYYHILNIDPKNPTDPHRDRFVLSKGHGSPTLYTILADLGYFDKKELETFRQFGSLCTSYPDMRTPGIDMVSGSLGNGLSTGIGMALNAKRKKIHMIPMWYWETENCRKVWYGKQLWQHLITD